MLASSPSQNLESDYRPSRNPKCDSTSTNHALADLERAVSAPREPLRFRANIYFTGVPWTEFDWVGRDIAVGDVILRVVKRTVRCPATEVNPATAERDADPVAELLRHYGHRDLGVNAEVVEGGRLAIGDAIRLI